MMQAAKPVEGRKDDQSKRRFDLLPWRAVGQVVDVLGFGARKYADHNWVKVPNARERYFAAAQRHLNAWWLGESIDPETGLPHLAHAACCVLFLLSFEVGHDQ
jgi:hypothetical protein